MKVTIEDSGRQLQTTEKEQDARVAYHKSMGIHITLKRIEALGHLYESKTSYKISDLETGTRVELMLPLLEIVRE